MWRMRPLRSARRTVLPSLPLRPECPAEPLRDVLRLLQSDGNVRRAAADRLRGQVQIRLPRACRAFLRQHGRNHLLRRILRLFPRRAVIQFRREIRVIVEHFVRGHGFGQIRRRFFRASGRISPCISCVSCGASTAIVGLVGIVGCVHCIIGGFCSVSGTASAVCCIGAGCAGMSFQLYVAGSPTPLARAASAARRSESAAVLPQPAPSGTSAA